MSESDYPIVNPRRCTDCSLCVLICPEDCLAMSSHGPWLPRPKDCVSCSLCELICPADAIHIPSNRSAQA